MIKIRSDKMDIIDNLQITLQKAQRLRMTLRLHHNDAEVNKVEAKMRALKGQIDALVAAAMDDWKGSATTVMTEIRAANTGLQSSIRDIQKSVQTAQRITKALGQLDAVIDKAKKLI